MRAEGGGLPCVSHSNSDGRCLGWTRAAVVEVVRYCTGKYFEGQSKLLNAKISVSVRDKVKDDSHVFVA